MGLVCRKILAGKNAESGFVLILALIGIMILLAVGYFALTVSTGDLRIAARLVGERKSFSAAESGVHDFCRVFNGNNFSSSSDLGTGWHSVDATNDPTVRYSYATPVRNATTPSVVLPGFDMTKTYTGALFDVIVTGEDTAYDAETQIAVGIATAPNPSDTQQGNL